MTGTLHEDVDTFMISQCLIKNLTGMTGTLHEDVDTFMISQ